MKLINRKLLPCLLIFLLILSVVPAVIMAAEPATVSTELELNAAIAAIPEGGSGEIVIQDSYIVLNEGIYFEFKDITFNLINSQLITPNDGNVIFGYGANITINADENSLIQAQGNTYGAGAVAINNSSDWDPETETYEKDFTLTVNGGKYTCAEGDFLFAVMPGTKVALTDVLCNGAIELVDMSGVDVTVLGDLTIHSGKFTNDIRQYAADGKYACQYGENYYVRDKEFSDDFSKPLTDGKIVFPYVKPSADDESVWLVAEDFHNANLDFYLDPESFQDDFSKLELGLYTGTSKEEFHIIDVVWDYDPAILQTAQSFIEKFPEDRPWFNVSDLELVNYWAYHNPGSEIDSLANYSGELKSILGNSNFLYNVEVRGGADDVFYTERVGSAKLIHDGKVYFSSTMIGARAEHAIYVPENTAETKDALIAAAQKRIDDYIGENIVKITATNETVTEYYNSTIQGYDQEIAAAQEIFDREAAKPEMERDWDAYWRAKSTLDYTPGYKQFFVESFNDGGDLHFLTKATGDFFFHVEVISTNEIYKFIVIKDDTKLSVPSYAAVDLNTNISVTTNSSTVPLDTVIEVDKLTEGEEYDRIINILDVEANETFDIKLHSGSLDEYVTKLENEKFEVKIPLSDTFKGKTLIAYYVDENNIPVEYEVTPKGDYAAFVTDHFSIYTLAEKPGATQDHTQHSGGTATCCAKALCSECNQPYGELDPANHAGGTELRNTKEATESEKGYTGDTYCAGCGVLLAAGEDIPAKLPEPSPQTGDHSQLYLFAALALAAAISIISLSFYGKKRNAV